MLILQDNAAFIVKPLVICHQAFINNYFIIYVFTIDGRRPLYISQICSNWLIICLLNSLAPSRCRSSGLILGLRPANERWCYIVMMSLIGWMQV